MPISTDTSELAEVKELLLYSPLQVAFGSLLGGPIAATYFLATNFSELQRVREAYGTAFIGALSVLIFVWKNPALHEAALCVSLLNVLLAVTSYWFVRKRQWTVAASSAPASRVRRSRWLTFLMSLMCMLLYLSLLLLAHLYAEH